MIPFEKFHEKKPEDELRFIAKNLGFSPPEFKFWKLPHQGYFATVQVSYLFFICIKQYYILQR